MCTQNRHIPHAWKNRFWWVGFALLTAGTAHAYPAETPASSPALCGVVEQSVGQVQILDENRSQVSDAVAHTGIPCNGWVSVDQAPGWIRIRHRSGHLIQAASGSFFQVTDQADQIVVFRGQVFGQTLEGSTELRIITSNARARVAKGSIVVIFNPSDEDTQLIALERSATLENRFKEARRIVVKGGEASSLNFKLLRIVPSTPRAVSVASLKEKLSLMALDSREESQALKTAHDRELRKFAQELDGDEGGGHRAPASDHGVEGATYQRRVTHKDDARLKNYFLNKMVAGQDASHRTLHPRSGAPARKPAGKIEIKAPKAGIDSEKKRLIDELSRIRAE